jgi:hypothetical protein
MPIAPTGIGAGLAAPGILAAAPGLLRQAARGGARSIA